MSKTIFNALVMVSTAFLFWSCSSNEPAKVSSGASGIDYKNYHFDLPNDLPSNETEPNVGSSDDQGQDVNNGEGSSGDSGGDSADGSGDNSTNGSGSDDPDPTPPPPPPPSGSGNTTNFSNGGSGGGLLVSALEVECPNVSSYNVSGVIPVPANTVLPSGSFVFQLVDSNNQTFPAQANPVTYHVTGKPKTVELNAVVQPNCTPGNRIIYNVERLPSPSPMANDGSSLISSAVHSADPTYLETSDVFGNIYRLDLFNPVKNKIQATEMGENVVRFEGNGDLKPIAPSSTTLSNILSVKSFFEIRKSTPNIIKIDLLVNNSTTGSLQKGVYFSGLYLYANSTYQVASQFEHPSQGTNTLSSGLTKYTIISPLANGKLHLMRANGRLSRRLALAPINQLARAQALFEEGFAVVRPGYNAGNAKFWSWWNPSTAYLGMNFFLPWLDQNVRTIIYTGQAQKYQSAYNDLKNCVASGLSGPCLGPYHPWGVKYGGMTGGTEITVGTQPTHLALSGNSKALSWEKIVQRRYNDRHACGFLTQTGEPLQIEDLIQNVLGGNIVPIGITSGQDYDTQIVDPFGFLQASNLHINAVQSQGKQPPYESELQAYDCIDWQHNARFMNANETIAWLANDAMSKFILRINGYHFLLYWNQYPINTNGALNLGGSFYQHASNYPGMGSSAMGRAHGHGARAALGLLGFAKDVTERTAIVDWLRNDISRLKDCQMSNGFCERKAANSKGANNYDWAQSFEYFFQINFMAAAKSELGQDASSNSVYLNEIANYINVSNSTLKQPLIWDSGANAPHHLLSVADKNGGQPLPTNISNPETKGGHDRDWAYHVLSRLYEVTGDPGNLTYLANLEGVSTSNLCSSTSGALLGNLKNYWVNKTFDASKTTVRAYALAVLQNYCNDLP